MMKSRINEPNQGKMPGTTVVLRLNQGTHPTLGGFKRRGPFFGQAKKYRINGVVPGTQTINIKSSINNIK